MEKDWVLIFSSITMHEVYMNKIYLEENGIEAVIINKQDSVYNAFGEIELFVNRDDVIKAKRLLQS